MTRKEDASHVGVEQPPKTQPKPDYGLNPVVSWLSEFEERIASDFYRRTGLDYKTTLSHIVEAADPFPGMQVLDVPTGTGVIARQFVGKVGEKGKIIGADATQEKISQARLAAQSARVGMRVEWKVTPFEKLAFKEESFDLVTSTMTFHLLDTAKFLAEAYRVLKPGGRLLIADQLDLEENTESFRDAARRAYLRFIKRDEAEAEAKFPRSDALLEMLQNQGFGQIIFRTLRENPKYKRVFSLVKAVK